MTCCLSSLCHLVLITCVISIDREIVFGGREVDDYPKDVYSWGTTHALLNNYEEAEEGLLRARRWVPQYI
jgi:hypothetical protein